MSFRANPLKQDTAPQIVVAAQDDEPKISEYSKFDSEPQFTNEDNQVRVGGGMVLNKLNNLPDFDVSSIPNINSARHRLAEVMEMKVPSKKEQKALEKSIRKKERDQKRKNASFTAFDRIKPETPSNSSLT